MQVRTCSPESFPFAHAPQVLLSDSGGGILEGLVTNFHVVVAAAAGAGTPAASAASAASESAECKRVCVAERSLCACNTMLALHTGRRQPAQGEARVPFHQA